MSRRAAVMRAPAGPTLLGLVGCGLLTIAGARLAGTGADAWFFRPRLPGGTATNTVALYVGIGVLVAAWLWLGGRLGPDRITTGQLTAIAALWSVPLLVGAPLFSHDVYSYLAQGTVVHAGLNPYHHGPGVLGHAPVVAAVSRMWRATPAPYGPLYLAAASIVVALTGSHLTAGVLVLRGLGLIGMALIAVFVPRLARRLGADPVRALWLTALSPLVLLDLVAAGHNDVLMAGLLVTGIVLGLEGRPAAGIALCALAATIKLPALLAVAFLAVAWWRSESSAGRRAAVLAGAAAVSAAVLGVVSAGSGLGLSWLSGQVISTPGRVHLADTPVTAISWTAAHLLRDVGVAIGDNSLQRALVHVGSLLTVLVVLGAVRRVRFGNLAWCVGLTLVAAALLGPAAWPWYFTWGLVLLAAVPRLQRSPALVGLLAASAFLIEPSGQFVAPVATAPAFLCAYAAAVAGAAALTRRRRSASGARDTGAGVEPALVGS